MDEWKCPHCGTELDFIGGALQCPKDKTWHAVSDFLGNDVIVTANAEQTVVEAGNNKTATSDDG